MHHLIWIPSFHYHFFKNATILFHCRDTRLSLQQKRLVTLKWKQRIQKIWQIAIITCQVANRNIPWILSNLVSDPIMGQKRSWLPWQMTCAGRWTDSVDSLGRLSSFRYEDHGGLVACLSGLGLGGAILEHLLGVQVRSPVAPLLQCGISQITNKETAQVCLCTENTSMYEGCLCVTLNGLHDSVTSF